MTCGKQLVESKQTETEFTFSAIQLTELDCHDDQMGYFPS